VTWTLQWALGGDAGIADDVDASWSESISLTRSTGNWRSASVVALLPIDMRTERAHPRTGFAVLLWDGVERIRGRWKSPAFIPTSDGRARFEFDLSDSDEDDAGVWPPTSTQYPRQSPTAVTSTTVVELTPGGVSNGARFPATYDWNRPVLARDEFPDIATPAEGATWPYPIGAPGLGSDHPAAPAYVYDASIIGGHTRKAGISGVPASCASVTVYGPAVDVWTVTVIAATNNTAYTLVLVSPGGTFSATYTSDASATIDEIVTGLASAWNGTPETVAAGYARPDTGANTVVIYGAVIDQRFTVSKSIADLTLTHTTTASAISPAPGIATAIGDRDNGTSFSYFELSDISGVIDASPDNQFYWSSSTDATPSGAGDVVLSILAASSMVIDFAEWARIADRLNRYRLDGYCDAVTTPTTFLKAQVLPLLPLSVVPGPLGLRPVLWPWLDDTAARGIEVVDGIGVAVGERVEYLDAQSLDSMTVRFGYDPQAGRCVLHTTANSTSTVYAALSSDALGSDEIEARLLWDRATAQLVTTDAMRWRSWSPRVLEVEIVDRAKYGPGGTDDLYPGRRVVLTCDVLGVASIAAMVGEREYDADTALIRVYLLDDPLTAA